MTDEYIPLKAGEKIHIKEYDGTNGGVHTVVSVEYSQWNDICPQEINTCCGRYIPTSIADGRWEHEMRLGGWDIIKS